MISSKEKPSFKNFRAFGMKLRGRGLNPIGMDVRKELDMNGRERAEETTFAGGPASSPAEALKEATSDQEVLHEDRYNLDAGGSLVVAVCKGAARYRLTFITDLPGSLFLHWGVSRQGRRAWALPPPSMRPQGTVVFDEVAVQTPFILRGDGLACLELDVAADDLPMGVCFVVKDNDTGRWLKDKGKDFYIPVDDSLYRGDAPGDSQLAALADPIISAETSPNSWTLMHRFNLCHDLLDRVRGDVQGLALLFIWLRYSAIRQLDWQRNYNTKPKELAHALDRLTQKLAETYAGEPAGRGLVRLMFTSVGRGGEGQRIRDEILEIMHRHHVKEVSGHFLEEWHQKLHNNTTPDDIVICEGYIAFLKSHGDLDVFYRTLREGGVTRERLESYERPIRSAPDLVPHIRDGLIRDFEHFLGTLRSLHSGVDLETAVNASGGLLDGAFEDLLLFLLQHREDEGLPAPRLAEKIFEARSRIKEALDRGREVRELLFLDLALESALRAKVEQDLDRPAGLEDRVELIRWTLENFSLAEEDPEIEACLNHWRVVAREPGSGKDWALEAGALSERLTRGLAGFGERFRDLLQPKAEFLGKAFGADVWAVEIFSEEVVRGTLVSVLSTLLHDLQPRLRKAADLGDWQVISPGQGGGRLEVVTDLESVQRKRFDQPAVILADRLSGYEEIPEGVQAILTPAGVDALSHLAIRARNGQILFATCYNPETIDGIRSLEGESIRVKVSGSGDVKVEQGEGGPPREPTSRLPAGPAKAFEPSFREYALPLERFEDGVVGRKSLNLRRLADQVPPWISVPRSVAVPFGVFERVLKARPNQDLAHRHDRMVEGLEDGPHDALEELKRVVLSLEAPQGLMEALFAVMEKAGLARPGDREEAWTCIKRVWASTWNERAFLSRRARGMDHGNLRMAVLIQEVVDAEYGFVLHTANPLSGNREELYAEVVLGLGETLVGNHPGNALRIVCPKGELDPRILAYPSKSFGLYGKGLIFRSDSSGEDLAGYAGAGLYDSFLLNPPDEVRLDYAEEPLVRDKAFLKEFAVHLTRVGMTVENLFGGPQDIEGAHAGGRTHVVQTRPQVGFDDG
jgi:alpha-glucan,water dikinase